VFYTIEDDDIAHITETADTKVRTLVKAIGGQSEVDRWLNNKESLVGSSFNPVAIENAFDAYEPFMAYKPTPAYKVLFVDPSGTGHPVGYFLGACDQKGTEFWELASGTLQLGETLEDLESDMGLTDEQIKQKLLKLARNHQINLFAAESNMNGKQLKQFFLLKGFTAINQNFGPDDNRKRDSRAAMITFARKIMDNNAMYLDGFDLKNELLIYNPDDHSTAKYKGDAADAMIHCMYRLMKLSNSPYLATNNVQFSFI